MLKSRNVYQIQWKPEPIRVRAYITSTADVELLHVRDTLQSLGSAVATSKQRDRWLVFDRAQRELRGRVGALDMLAPVDPGTYRVISCVNLDVAIMYIVSSYRKWRFDN